MTEFDFWHPEALDPVKVVGQPLVVGSTGERIGQVISAKLENDGLRITVKLDKDA